MVTSLCVMRCYRSLLSLCVESSDKSNNKADRSKKKHKYPFYRSDGIELFVQFAEEPRRAYELVIVAMSCAKVCSCSTVASPYVQR